MASVRMRSVKGFGPVPRIGPERLKTGWGGPNGCRIRIAAGDETGQVLRLWEPLELGSDATLEAAMAGGAVSGLVTLGLRDGPKAILGELARSTYEGDPAQAFLGLSCVLVAHDRRSGQIVGALAATPPTNVLSRAMADGSLPLEGALIGAAMVTKVMALAVDEQARGQGIGAALLRRCQQIYFHLGFNLVYGSFRIGTGLDRFYARQGFTVHDVGEGISLAFRLALPLGIYTDSSEQLFSRWRTGGPV